LTGRNQHPAAPLMDIARTSGFSVTADAVKRADTEPIIVLAAGNPTVHG